MAPLRGNSTLAIAATVRASSAVEVTRIGMPKTFYQRQVSNIANHHGSIFRKPLFNGLVAAATTGLPLEDATAWGT
jgi:hypothetical protein